MTPHDFRTAVILPALLAIDAYSLNAETLLLATAMTESNLTKTHQDGGPALGYFQMEPATHHDLFANFLGATSRQHLMDGLHKISDRVGYVDELENNPQYAAALARIFYLRCPGSLPDSQDLNAIYDYYKCFWNTKYGKATRDHFMAAVKGIYTA